MYAVNRTYCDLFLPFFLVFLDLDLALGQFRYSVMLVIVEVTWGETQLPLCDSAVSEVVSDMGKRKMGNIDLDHDVG